MDEQFTCLYESFVPIIPLDEDSVKSTGNVLKFISNKLLSESSLRSYTIEALVEDYFRSYEELNRGITIAELFSVYNDCRALLLESDDPSNEYTEDMFEYNGFIKSTFVIHEHDSKRAPLHWDLRFKTEFGTSAYSFVLLKHRMPNPQSTERLLVKRQPMHPPQWVDMDHTTIGEGYGQGSVKTIDRGIIYYKMKDNSFSFYLKGKIYKGPYHLVNVHHSIYLLFNAANSILSNPEGRNKEWIKYAQTFLSYINSTFRKKFSFPDDLITYKEIRISEDNSFYYNLESFFKEGILYIPSIKDCLDIKKMDVDRITSSDCKINNIEDVMRLLLLRNIISPLFFQYLDKSFNSKALQIEDIYNNIRDVPYTDEELKNMKSMDYKNFMIQKVYRMFSDIYLGHKYYGQMDFERFLMNRINTQ